jgi:hypothetical protein
MESSVMDDVFVCQVQKEASFIFQSTLVGAKIPFLGIITPKV